MPKKHFALFACVAGLFLVLLSHPARSADDPYVQWWTISTPHARVHYYKGCEAIAQRIADVLENLHTTMSKELRWSPHEVTEVVLSDRSDDANGSATALPYNTLRLFITAPDDMSPLGDHDDWHLELVSHEYTHLLHTDHITGLPAILNAVIGKTFAPNQAQPRWILEGVATLNESRKTSGGRIRSSMFDMFLRADVLDDRVVPLDQMTNFVRRWPQGNIWYLYGSRFMQWITDTYGFDVVAAIAEDTSGQLIPYGVNRTIRRATGRTYEELYDGWKSWLREHYDEQLLRVLQRGLREGVQITNHGQWVGRPRFIPAPARTTHSYAEVLYYRNDNAERTGFYRLVLDQPTSPRPQGPEAVARVAGVGSASFGPDGSLYFNSSEIWQRVYSFNDIIRLPPRTTAPSGLESHRQRLTFGRRAQDPDISPDGREIVYTVSHRGTTYLKIARITPEGGVDNDRTLLGSAQYEQAYTPRFSPDGNLVAYSAWTRGGYRDIRIVERSTGRFRELMHDRAMDTQPSFSRNGRYLLFSSDRTGIANIYAYEMASGNLWQVTNVRMGAFQPELSPDGHTLIYVGYTSYGFDLFAMPFDPTRFLPALDYVSTREPVAPDPPRTQYEVRPYNPLPSLRPRAFQMEYGPGTFGQALTIRTIGADVVGHHSISLAAAIETQEAVPYAGVSYNYGRLPFDYYMSLWRSVSPRRGYRLNDTEPLWLDTNLGWSTGISYAKPTAFDSQNYSIQYTVSRSSGELPVGRSLDPYSQYAQDPSRGFLGVVHFGWGYSNVEQYLYSVGPRRGLSVGFGGDVANLYTASQYSVYAFSYNANAYVPMPWVRNHTLAMHFSGATATGDYSRRGLYYVGGFGDTDIVQAIRYSIFQGGYVLRGYKPTSFIGSQYHLFNFEYRFPIMDVDRGLSTLPVFLQRVSGNLFLDYGGSFDRLDTQKWRSQFHTGIGAELWAELQIAYFTTLNLRFGYAKGYGAEALEGGQKYVVIAMPY